MKLYNPLERQGGRAKTLVEAMQFREAAQADEWAITYLIDGEDQEAKRSYGEFGRRARAIGAALQAAGAEGQTVLMVFNQGLEFVEAFYGCLYARAIAVPVVPPDPSRLQRSVAKLVSIAIDCQAQVVLTTSELLAAAAPIRKKAPVLDKMQWIAVDAVEDAAAFREVLVPPDQLAFLQYTSGSTSTPKGVMVSHANLHHNVGFITEWAGERPDRRWISWLPTFHDMGLIGAVLGPLHHGYPAVFMSPLHFLKRPYRWLKAITKHRATVTVAPNFGYELCVRKVSDAEVATLDLSSCVRFMNGAEPVRLTTFERFAGKFGPVGFDRRAYAPCYGLAEATLMVSSHDAEAAPFVRHLDRKALEGGQVKVRAAAAADTQPMIGCGKRAADQDIAIVDPVSLTRCAEDRIGEIWIAGPSVTKGYWNRADATKESYGLALDGRGGYFRTGDLGFLDGGDLFVTGRLKDLIIVRGTNHYPQDIELTAEEVHRAVRPGCAAAFTLELGEQERLALVAEIDTDRVEDPAALAEAIRRAIVETHDLSTLCVVLIEARSVPKTSSGKIQRRATKGELLGLRLEVVHASFVREAEEDLPRAASWLASIPAERRKQTLTTMISSTLAGLVEDPSQVEPARPLDRAGVTLDVALGLDRALIDTIGVGLPLGRTLERPTIDALVDMVLASIPAVAAPAPEAPAPAPRSGDVERWLVARVATASGRAASAIDVERPFADYGLGSAESVEVASDLERWLGRPVSATLAWDYPTIRAAAQHLAGDGARPLELEAAATEEPIAIVGAGCRFPGASSPEAFWSLLTEGRDAIRAVDRWDAEGLYDPRPGTPGRLSTKWAGLLDRVDEFDPHFFNVSSREAARIDPQQRLLLEVAWEALEDAGCAPDRLAGSRTGVFVGISSSDYLAHQTSAPEKVDAYTATGNALSIAANRISYTLDLRGPSLAVDTACSSSLMAVHLAVKSLREGESTLALAGGVNVILSPELTMSFSHAHMMAADGKCKTYDARADGYVRGEGAGVLVLERLSDALARGHRIMALIRGSATVHDGRSNGLSAPNGPAQEAVIRAALAKSGVDAGALDFIEAHGTGTALGDAIEIQALQSVLRDAPRAAPCLVSSVKTNIGHLEAAAGVAGLLKTALSLERGEVPPHLNLVEPNPQLRLDARLIDIPGERRALPAGAIAGVSSFGFGGTNVHLVLESPPAREAATGEPFDLLCVSARTESALLRLAGKLAEGLEAVPEASLSDVCHTLFAGRARLDQRVAVRVSSVADAREKLRAIARGEPVAKAIRGARGERAPKLAFLFAGQGSQYVGMGQHLYQSQPTFRRALDRCAELLDRHIDRPLLSLLFPRRGEPDRLADTRYTQPALVAVEWAMAELWRSFGVEPDVVLGHSVGEYAAAAVAGMLTIEDALSLIATRARLMAGLPAGGGMMAVVLDAPSVERELAGKSHVAIAALNGPDNTVVAGPIPALESLKAALERRGISAHPLNVSHAFHSPLMDPVLAEFEAAARQVSHAPLRIPLVSNLRGEVLEAGDRVDAAYWRRHLREPVRFAAGAVALAARGVDVFVEIGPKTTALAMAKKAVDLEGAAWLPTTRPGPAAVQPLVDTAAELWVRGVAIDAEAFSGARRVVSLPPTQFERSRYWIERESARSERPMSKQNPNDTLESVVALFREQAAAIARLAGSAEAPRAIAELRPAPAPAPMRLAEPANGGAHALVVREIAAVSGFPVERIRGGDRVAADLGFDSLMLADLRRRIVAEHAGIEEKINVPLTEDLAVADLVGIVSSAIGGGVAVAVVPKEAPVKAASPSNGANGHAEYDPDAVPREAWDLELWPEYKDIKARIEIINSSGGNPYARIHESMNGDTTVIEGREIINYASFNYLGLSNDPAVRRAAKQAIDVYGTSASATPLLLGETPLHMELEAEINELIGTEASMVFPSGHATNVTTVGHLVGAGDLIIHDELIHDSSIRGALLSGARRLSFPHNDVAALDATLAKIRNRYRRLLIIIEGVYSQDGDIAPLPALIAVKNRYKGLLMIDEAHSIGVLGARGAGIGEHFNVDRDEVEVWMGTLSKGLGSCGGYIAGSQKLIHFLKFTAPGFIFGTSISPANAAAAMAAIRTLKLNPERAKKARDNAALFKRLANEKGFDTGLAEGSAIVPVIVGAHDRACKMANMLFERGICAMPIGFPAVPKTGCRIRFFLNSTHSVEQIRYTVDALADVSFAERNATNEALRHMPQMPYDPPRRLRDRVGEAIKGLGAMIPR